MAGPVCDAVRALPYRLFACGLCWSCFLGCGGLFVPEFRVEQYSGANNSGGKKTELRWQRNIHILGRNKKKMPGLSRDSKAFLALGSGEGTCCRM